MSFQKHLLLLIICLFFSNIFSSEQFITQNCSSRFFLKNTEIQYHLDNKMVGFISYTKIPLMTYYALHSFFIYPEYRNKGYGKKLLLYACDYLKTTDGAKKIYIQPGPFEIEHGNMKTIPNEVRSQKIQELIKLYQYAGFEFVSTFTSTCVRFYIDY